MKLTPDHRVGDYVKFQKRFKGNGRLNRVKIVSGKIVAIYPSRYREEPISATVQYAGKCYFIDRIEE